MATPTLQAIAREAGLSVATVSNILHGRYKGNTPKGRQRTALVTGLAERLGYVANASARRLRTGLHHAVIVLVPVDDFGMPTLFAYEYLMGIASALRHEGMAMLVQPHPRGRGHDAELPRERAFDAALVLDEIAPGTDAWLDAMGIPAGFVNIEPTAGRLVVARDEQAAGADLVGELARLGYRRALLVGDHEREAHFSYALRARGIAAAAAEHGVACERLAMPWWSGRLPDELARRELDPRAVVIAMDAHAALVLMRHLPPGQPLACCDRPHLFHEIARDLTCARFDRQALGRLAAESLLMRLRNPAARFAVAPLRFEVQVGPSTPPVS